METGRNREAIEKAIAIIREAIENENNFTIYEKSAKLVDLHCIYIEFGSVYQMAMDDRQTPEESIEAMLNKEDELFLESLEEEEDKLLLRGQREH